jgi:hypothetical protein
MRRLINFFFGIFLLTNVIGQVPLEERIKYPNEISFGFNSNTNGGLISGVNLRYTYRYEDKRYRLFYLEMVNVKHEKEERFSSSGGTGTFIPTKVSYLFSVRPSYGKEINLFQKFPENGIRLNWCYSAGPSIGLVKPYMIKYPRTDTLGTEIVPYDPTIHSIGKIEGDAGIFNGFNLAKFNPGVHARTSLNFEYGPYDDLKIGVETGITAEAFARKNILMLNNEARHFYTAFFVHFYYGFTF